MITISFPDGAQREFDAGVTGADIAAWICYSLSKRFSKTPEKFGKGYEEGVADAGAANNSAVAGAWVPALVFRRRSGLADTSPGSAGE